MKRSHFRRTAIASLAIAVLAFGPARKAAADVILGSSLAYGESISVTFTPSATFAALLPTVTLTSGPLPVASGIAPLPYSVSNNFLGASILLPPTAPIPFLKLDAAAFPVNASSNVNALPGARFAHADAAVASLALSFGVFFPAKGILPPISLPLLTLGVTGISSRADVTGDYPLLSAAGSTNLGELVLDGPLLPGGRPITIHPGSPAPNTQLIPPGSTGLLSVLLNEQRLGGNGVTSRSLSVNAIDISFTGIPVLSPPLPPPFPIVPLGTLSGKIILAHSDALLVAVPPVPPVPEPASFVLAAIGCVLLVFRRGLSEKGIGTEWHGLKA